jgi:hypothetical protein
LPVSTVAEFSGNVSDAEPVAVLRVPDGPVHVPVPRPVQQAKGAPAPRQLAFPKNVLVTHTDRPEFEMGNGVPNRQPGAVQSTPAGVVPEAVVPRSHVGPLQDSAKRFVAPGGVALSGTWRDAAAERQRAAEELLQRDRAGEIAERVAARARARGREEVEAVRYDRAARRRRGRRGRARARRRRGRLERRGRERAGGGRRRAGRRRRRRGAGSRGGRDQRPSAPCCDDVEVVDGCGSVLVVVVTHWQFTHCSGGQSETDGRAVALLARIEECVAAAVRDRRRRRGARDVEVLVVDDVPGSSRSTTTSSAAGSSSSTSSGC